MEQLHPSQPDNTTVHPCEVGGRAEKGGGEGKGGIADPQQANLLSVPMVGEAESISLPQA
jgi:hypothetical protein